METKVNVPFECIMTFSTSDNIPAMVIRRIDDNDQHYVLSSASGVRIQPSGAVFNVEYIKRGEKLLPPPVLEFGWRCFHIGNSTKHLRTLFLAKMYHLLSVQSDDSAVLFKHPDLELLDSLYKYIHGGTIHKDLAAEHYTFVRRAYYATFEGDASGASYNVPRMLAYYPKEKAVVVAWSFEDRVAPITLHTAGGTEVIPKGSKLLLQRVYQGTPWLSLRKLVVAEPKVKALVDALIASDFIKPRDLTEKYDILKPVVNN